MLANLLIPSWDGETLRDVWSSSRQSDRETLEEILIAHRQALLEAPESKGFEQAVVSSGIFEQWLQQLRDGRVARRVRAAMRLGYFHDPRGVAALVSAAEDPSPELALAVVLSLGRLKDPVGLPGLIRLTRRAPAVIPDLTLAAALAACAESCPAKLVSLLEAPEERSRVIGVWAISEVADSTVLPQLRHAAWDSFPEVRAKTARALARISDPESVEALNELARDPVWFVRVRALDALGRLHAPAGEATAFAALADKVREVRYRAAYTLRQIAGMESEIVLKVLAAGSRRDFNSMISEWERAGFLWRVVGELSVRDWAQFEESRNLLRALIAAGVTRALMDFVLVFPDLKVRLRLVRLLAEARAAQVRADLLALARQPKCDPRVAAAIRARVPDMHAGVSSGASSASGT